MPGDKLKEKHSISKFMGNDEITTKRESYRWKYMN